MARRHGKQGMGEGGSVLGNLEVEGLALPLTLPATPLAVPASDPR